MFFVEARWMKSVTENQSGPDLQLLLISRRYSKPFLLTSSHGSKELDWLPFGSDIGPTAKQIGLDLKAKTEKLEEIWASVDSGHTTQVIE